MYKKLLMGKRFLIFFIMIGVLACASPVFASSAEPAQQVLTANSDFSVDVVIGNRGYVYYGYSAQVTVTVVSAADFTGAVRLLPKGESYDWSTLVAYEQEVELAAGQAVTVTFSPSMYDTTASDSLQIQILDARENVVYAESDTSVLVTDFEETDLEGAIGIGPDDGSLNADYNTQAARIAAGSDSVARPRVWMIAVLLGIYVVVVGPVLYLILKRCKRREWLWAAIPVTAVVFVGILFVCTFGYRIRRPFIDTFTVVELGDDAQTQTVYAAVTCPQATTYAIALNSDYSNLHFAGDIGGDSWLDDLFTASSSRTTAYDMLLRQTDDGQEMLIDNESIFNQTAFSVSRTVEDSDGMDFSYDLSTTTTGVTGSVTNNTGYDLKSLVVYFEDHYVRFDDVPAGETVTFGEQSNLSFSKYSNTFFVYYYQLQHKTKQDYQIAQTNSMMENYYADTTPGSGCGAVWAYVADVPAQVSTDTTLAQSGSGVLYAAFTAEYEDVDGTYYASINDYITDGDGNYESYDATMYDETVTFTYELPQTDLLYLRNCNYYEKTSDVPSNENGDIYADVYAYNWGTEAYEEIFADSELLEGEQLSVYISEDGQIRLQYVTEEDYLYVAMLPRIAAVAESVLQED